MKKYYVLGSKIGYTLSPKIYKNLFELFGEEAQYSAFDVPEIEPYKEQLFGCDGFNVTKPFKKEIIKFLRRDESSCGSVNTVTSSRVGYSTDGDGFLYDFTRKFGSVSGATMLLIGYGGAASACAHALISSGARVFVTGRDEKKLSEFTNRFGAEKYGGERVDGVVSCVTECVPPRLDFTPRVCYDVRYFGETLKLGEANFDGLGMLVAQAIYSYAILTGKRFDNRDVDRLYLKLTEIL